MDSVQATNNQINKDQFYIPLEDLANNHGLSHLVNKIFSQLNRKELSTVRLVSKSLKGHIDNNKQWWIFQLEDMRTKPTNFADYPYQGAEKHVVTGLIETKFPEWKVANEYFIKDTSTERLRNFVLHMWKYFNDNEKSYCNPLHQAIYNGDIEFVRLLVDSPFDFNIQNRNGNSVISMKGYKNQIQILRLLINNAKKKKINFDTKDYLGYTPFHIACANASLDLVKLLQNHIQSENINLIQRSWFNGYNIFHMSVVNPDAQVPKYIFEQFMDNFEDSKTYNGANVIHRAIQYGTEETVNFLIESRKLFKIKIDATYFVGQNILHLICRFNKTDVFENALKCLKEDAFDIDVNTTDANGKTSLHYACQYGTLKTLKLLLSLKPNLKASTNHGDNIFHMAASNTNTDVLQYLLTTYSSKVEHTLNQFGWTTLHVACFYGFLDHVKLIFECPDVKSFDAGGHNGDTPMHIASLYGHFKVISYILSQSKVKSIDINKVNNYGETAEDIANLMGRIKVSEVFEMFRSNQSEKED